MRNGDRRGCKAPFAGLRHTSGKHAAKHTMIAVWSRRLGRVKLICLLSFREEDLCDGEPCDEVHASMTVQALP